MWKRRLKCSFCGRGEAEVAKLVAGPRVYICNECVTLASRIMNGESDVDSHAKEPKGSVLSRLVVRARRLFGRGVEKRLDSGAELALPN